MESQNTHDKKAITPQEIVIYQTKDGAVKVDVQMADETVWLTMTVWPNSLISLVLLSMSIS